MKNNNVSSFNPRIDEYINKLLDSADEYGLNRRSKKILNYVVYLLLNEKFQHLLCSFRLSLCMPIDGFKNEKEQDLWEVKFKEIVTSFHAGKTIDKRMKLLLGKIERDLNRPLIDREPKPNTVVLNICSNAIYKTSQYIFRYLHLGNTKNSVYWVIITRHLLLFDSPENIISHLAKWSKVFGAQSITFKQEDNRVKMTILLYPDTTIKDIEQLIEMERKKISEKIMKIEGQTRKNQYKTDDIKRDYFIYRTYMNHNISRKRDDNIYSNITKADAVKRQAEKGTASKIAKKAKYLETGSIRKIVDRMNRRIQSSFS